MNVQSTARYDFSTLNVLVVEDNKNMQKLLRTILNVLGVRNVYEVSSGVEALQELTRCEADIVISDWNMQPMNGLEFALKVRRDPNSPNPYVPIIMLTGHTETSKVIEARDAGVNLFLAKPVSVRALSESLTALIENPSRFVRTPTYFGPDRRRKDVGPPNGTAERRKPRD
jgi:two-component system chemotaxis response regulator CheY